MENYHTHVIMKRTDRRKCVISENVFIETNNFLKTAYICSHIVKEIIKKLLMHGGDLTGWRNVT